MYLELALLFPLKLEASSTQATEPKIQGNLAYQSLRTLEVDRTFRSDVIALAGAVTWCPRRCWNQSKPSSWNWGRDPPSGPGCGVQQEIEHAYNQVNKSGDI